MHPALLTSARRLLAVTVGATVLLTLGGYLLKAQCIGDYDTVRDSHLCSNDVQVLYLNRDLVHHLFPYVHGRLVDGQLTGGTLEYPVLTGLFAWFPALFVHDDGRYLQLTALLLAPFSLVTVALLTRMTGRRALLYAFSPALVWYSFHNWDLLVVCATVAALWAWWQQRYVLSGVLLAVGASLKLWPLFFLLPLLLERWTAGDRREALRSVGASVVALLVINLPFVIASPSGWYAPYAFQALRAADITSDSIWFWGFAQPTTAQGLRDRTSELNHVIPVLLAVAFVAACAWGLWRVRQGAAFPFVQVCGAELCAFMLTGKAHSPQYALWLLPFFCLLRLRWGWWLAYTVFDALTYVGLFRWYYTLSQGGDFGIAKQELVLGIWGRAVMLALLFVVFLRSEVAWAPPPVPEPVPDRVLVPA